jgi:hypothetical protein
MRSRTDTHRCYGCEIPRNLGFTRRAAIDTVDDMFTLHLEHPITDYETWRSAFENFAEARANAGVVDERVARPVDDPRYIVVDLDFESEQQAQSFQRFLETQVWSTPAASPGLAGRPKTAILERPQTNPG